MSSAKLREDLGELARKIKGAREEKRLTQEQLAARIEISPQHLRRLESPSGIRSVPSAFIVARIAKVVGQTTDYFLSHIRTAEELLDEELDDARRAGVLKKMGLGASGLGEMTLEAKRELLNVIRMAMKRGG